MFEIKSLRVILISCFIFLACGNSQTTLSASKKKTSKSLQYFCDFDSDSFSSEWKISKNIKGELDKFEHFKPNNRYGCTFDVEIPDSFQNTTIVVRATFKYRIFSNKSASFSAKQNDGKQVLWKGKSFSGDSAKWEVFQDSILIPANRKEKLKLRLHPYNPKSTTFDIDSVTIILKQKEFPSFVRDIKKHISKFPTVKINNPIFESISLVSLINGKLEPSYFELDKDGYVTASNNFFDIQVNNSKEQHGFLFGGTTNFKKATKVNRLALIYKYKGEITEVYRNNRMASNQIYGNEIWLGKEGFKLTIDSTNWFCYGYNQLSSFQILKEQKLLIVNIDYSQDHPLFHFPELDTIINKKEDISAN